MRSAWRGLARKTSMPKRALSKWAMPMANISMAQQARPNAAGHVEDLRAHLTSLSSVDVRMLELRSSSATSGCLPRCHRGRLGLTAHRLPVEDSLAPDVA